MVRRKRGTENEVVQIPETAVLDREQLREVTMDDEELMREILIALVDDTSRQLGLLAGAIEEQDAQKTARLAHYSKGACANVGANRAAAVLKEIENQAAARSFSDCAVTLQTLTREVELLRVEAR